MPNALLTGVSGLIAHQRMLDVVGNNLANLNTHGFKVKRLLFSDLLYETIRPAASSSSGESGGVNPNQIGSGVKVSQITSKFGQGNLELTGGDFDFAIQGDGFFVVNDGQRDLYTRNGAFGIDRNGFLVDPTNGFRVRRFGTVGEGGDNLPRFQDSNDPFIQIPLNTIIEGRPTTEVNLQGNLSSRLSKPKAAVLTSESPFTEGPTTPATASTLLNSLGSNTQPYAAGDGILISGVNHDGSPITTFRFAVDATTTMGDLINAINSQLTGATASLDASGNIVITAATEGTSSLRLTLADDSGNAGATQFVSRHKFLVTTKGSDGDTFERGIKVYDEQGGEHNVNLTFRKVADNRWNMTAQLIGGTGTVIDGSVTDIVFDASGQTVQVLGTGTGDAMLAFQFEGIPGVQSVLLNLSANQNSTGLTQVAFASDLEAIQDGFPPGALASVAVSTDGVISGVATNGVVVPIAQLAIASFRNRNGLNSISSNYFAQSLNSGDAQIGAGDAGSRGKVYGGQLEASNVDMALEFTNLIVAQRGFSANARTIKVADEVLEELVTIIR